MNSSRVRCLWPALVCAIATFLLFQFFGNATRGYIDTASAFTWWAYQWFNPPSETQHGPLVVLLAAWLVWRNLRSVPAEGDSSAPAAGAAAAALVAAATLHVLGYAVQQTRISIVALLVATWGVFALGGGRRWARATAFPLAFLVLAIPVGFLDDVGFWLRLGVSRTAAAIAHAFGVGVIRSGTQLFAPDGRFQYDVAAACSGIRSLVALLGLGLVLGYLRFRPLWLRAGFVLLTLPLAFAGNLLRILAIITAGHVLGQAGGERVHAWSGVLVFLVVLGGLLVAASLLARWAPGLAMSVCSPVDARRKSGVSATPAARGAAAVALAGLTVFGLAAAATRQLDNIRPATTTGVLLAENGVDPAPLPAFLGTEWIGQRAEVSDVERQLLPPDTGYSRRNYVAVSDRSRQVFFSVVLSGRDRSSIHRPELCLVGQGWTVLDRGAHDFPLTGGAALPATLLRVRLEGLDSAGRRVQVPGLFAYWFVSAEDVVRSHTGMLLKNAEARLLHLRSERWAYVVVQTTADDSEEAALARMDEVVRTVWPGLRAPAEPGR